VKRSLVASLLVCVLLGSGCGIVKSAAVRLLGPGVAAVFGGSEGNEAAVEPSGQPPSSGLSIAADEHAVDDVADDDEDEGGTGFYKIVEANGTVRFTSNLSEVPVEQRPKAERLAMAPSRPSARRAVAAPKPQRDTKQLAAAEAVQPPAARARSGGSHEVVLYTTSWCGWCKRTRSWLDGKGVEYTDKDVERDATAAAEMRDLTGGDTGVPVVVIDGEVIQGFDQGKMQKLLQI
jgi:glutaredoxin-like YruB-family protein